MILFFLLRNRCSVTRPNGDTTATCATVSGKDDTVFEHPCFINLMITGSCSPGLSGYIGYSLSLAVCCALSIMHWITTSGKSYSSQELHWLPVTQRILFKSLCIVFKALHGLGPKPLQGRFRWYEPARSLRSSTANLVRIPRIKRATLGWRAFSVAAARLWNSLPLEIRWLQDLMMFRKKVKTWLFPRV